MNRLEIKSEEHGAEISFLNPKIEDQRATLTNVRSDVAGLQTTLAQILDNNPELKSNIGKIVYLIGHTLTPWAYLSRLS